MGNMMIIESLPKQEFVYIESSIDLKFFIFQIWIRKIPDNCKMRISVGQLEKGQIFLRRR